jgi:hypothetical protein
MEVIAAELEDNVKKWKLKKSNMKERNGLI